MKKSTQIVNSPVISIQEGLELGTVTELVVNPENKSVEFLLVDRADKTREGEILAIPFRETVGVGEYAVTIEDQRILLDLSKMNIAGSLLDNRVKVIDEKVVTRKGKLLGKITEYLVDPDSGSITSLELLMEDNSTKSLPLEALVSLGRQVVIVTDEAENMLYPPTTSATEKMKDVTFDQIAEETDDRELPEEAVEAQGSSVEMFIARQKSFLLGKELKSDLKDATGEVLAAAGTTITPDLFDQVQRMGRQKVIELTMLTE